jgi:hypothetical protein
MNRGGQTKATGPKDAESSPGYFISRQRLNESKTASMLLRFQNLLILRFGEGFSPVVL